MAVYKLNEKSTPTYSDDEVWYVVDDLIYTYGSKEALLATIDKQPKYLNRNELKKALASEWGQTPTTVGRVLKYLGI